MANTKFDLSNRLFSLVVIFLVSLVAFFVFAGISIWQEVSGDYPREISVEATGSAYVVPDTAQVTLGLDVIADTAEEAVSQNSEIMDGVSALLADLEIDDKDIQTTYYNLGPNYQWTENEGSVQKGFRLNQNLTVKIKDFDIIGEVISGSTDAGANVVSGVSFTVDDVEEAKNEAREEAIAKATEKAEEIAAQSGLKLGKVLNYYEYGGEVYGKGGIFMEAASSYSEDRAVSLPSPNIEPGEQEVELTVNLVYRIK